MRSVGNSEKLPKSDIVVAVGDLSAHFPSDNSLLEHMVEARVLAVRIKV